MNGYCNRYPPLFKQYDYVMKKLIILVVVIVRSITCLTAQVGNQQMLKCVYLEEAINRTDQPDKITQDEFVLFVSGIRSAFYSRNARQYAETKDSLERLGISPMATSSTSRATLRYSLLDRLSFSSVVYLRCRMQIQAKPMNRKRFWSCLPSNGGRKLVQMRVEPSLLELCRVQPSFCKLLQTVYRLTFSYSK